MQRRTFLATSLAAVTAPWGPTAQAEQPRWRPDGAGRLARIGVLTTESDAVSDTEMVAMAPIGISVHTARVRDPQTPEGYVQPPHIDTAIERLAGLSLRAIVSAWTGSSYVLGTEADERTRTRLEARVRKVPVVLAVPAATEALRVLGAKRVALIHPPWYSEDLNARGGEYFRGHGFDVVLCERLTPLRSGTEIEPAEVYEWVRAKTPPQAEAVFIGGSGFRSIGAIQALEMALGRSVLTANQVGFWAALRAANVKAEVVNYGRIFTHA